MFKKSATIMLVQTLLLIISLVSSILVKSVEHMSGVWMFAFAMVVLSILAFMALNWVHESFEGEVN